MHFNKKWPIRECVKDKKKKAFTVSVFLSTDSKHKTTTKKRSNKQKNPVSVKTVERLLGERFGEGVIRGETTYKGRTAACYSLILRLGLV